jgi:hypothetical protein
MSDSTVSAPRPAVVPANNRFVVAIALATGAATRLAAVPLGPTESRVFAQPLDGASRATVRLQFGAGNLSLGALEPADSNLATANCSGPSSYVPEPTFRVRDGVGELAYLVRDTKIGLPFFRGDEHTRMSVRLARTTPFRR